MVATLRTRVQERMDELDLRAVDVAARVNGMSASAVSQFLSGKSKGVKPENLVDLAEALQCTERWLVYGTESRKPYPQPPHNKFVASEPPALEHFTQALKPPTDTRSLIDQLGEALDCCSLETRTAVASLLQHYALSPKPGAVADALVMFLERCKHPNADNPFAGASPPKSTQKGTK